MTDPKIQVVCSHCGSAGVTRDAVVRYDTDAQEWSLSGVFDNADCDICGGETSLEEVPLDQWNDELVEAKELHGKFFQAEERVDGSIAGSIFTEDGVVLKLVTEDEFGVPFTDLGEALDACRKLIIQEAV